MVLQKGILAALPEEKRPVMDSVHDAINTFLMDEGEYSFIEGVTFGGRGVMQKRNNLLEPLSSRTIRKKKGTKRVNYS